MRFMVIERLRDDDMIPVYERLRDASRQLPDGLTCHARWIEPNSQRCFQLMACDDLRLLQARVRQRRGTGVTFEIVPVVSSEETRAVVAPFLNPPP